MLNLRIALRFDAAASGGLGAALLVLFNPAEEVLGMPVALSVTVGVLLLAWAGFLAWVAMNPTRALVREVIALNVGYVALSVVFAVADWVQLAGLGVAFVLVQAVVVLGLAVGQVALMPRAEREAVAA